MKSRILFAVLVMFSITPIFAMQDGETLSGMPLFLKTMGTLLSGFVAFIIPEASKHIFGGNGSLGIFLKTNAMPFVWNLIGAAILTVLVSFAPAIMPFVEAQIGGSVEIESYGELMLSGSILGGLIKGLYLGIAKIKEKKRKEKK